MTCHTIRGILSTAFVGVLALTLSSSVNAEIVAHEPFDYEIGDLDSNAGGIGFGDEWIVTSEFTVEVIEPVPPLSYTLPGGATINGGNRAMRFGNDEDDLILANEGEAAVRELADVFEGDELYFSFLYRYDEDGFVDDNDFVVWWLDTVGDGPQMGLKGNGGDGSVPDDFTGRVNGQFAPPQQAIVEGPDISDEAGTLGTDFFIVGKASREGNTDIDDDYDEFSVWVNPAANEAGDPHAVAFGDAIDNGDGGRLLTTFVERLGLRIFNQEPGDAMYWDELRLGTTWDDVTSAIGDAGVAGDFDGDGTLTASDIDLLANAIREGRMEAQFDLNADGSVDASDHATWVIDLVGTWFGDANFDGEFNSSDLVTTFTTGQYEDGEAGNSGWAAGDWNGSGDFDSSDFVTAFSGGGYEIGPRQATNAVPEPTCVVPVFLAVCFVSRLHHRGRR